MYKYLRYITILILKIVGKIIGVPMFYLLLPLRGYARNRVYNYVLENDIYLPRLIERDWRLDKETNCYYPHNQVNKNFNLKDKAYIKYRKVSKLEYYFALFIWVWFDDDSNFDTHDGKPKEETALKIFGTTWDLGDLRAVYPVTDLKKTFYWICRNSFYNFNYMFEEIRENDKNNFFKIIKIFGFKTVWGYIPYTNSERKGRMVFLREDIDKIDKELLS